LIGDFQLDDYRDTTGMTVLVLLFCTIGVIVLLNVVIAVIGDAYERASIGSVVLFMQARITFVAQNEALEAFLRPGSSIRGSLGTTTGNMRVLIVIGRILRWFVLLSLIATTLSSDFYLLGRMYSYIERGYGWVTFVFVLFFFILLTVALFIVLRYAFEGLVRSCAPDVANRWFSQDRGCTRFLVKKVATFIFGLGSKRLTSYEEDSRSDEEWTGRLTYLEKSFERTIQKAKEELSEEIAALEKRLDEKQIN